MTAHSFTILSELKMSPPPFGPYAGAKTHSLAIALLTALCPTVPQLCGLVIGARVAGQGSKYVIMFI